MAQQPRLIPDAGQANEIDDREKEAYRERLRNKLQDPDFRQIEGFPLGKDEDILALSDPPYYTACPNPFLPEIIEQWQEERKQIREEFGLPADKENGAYHREPFASDVSEGKNNAIYNAHTYHTKVPHRAIMRYIMHYTDPGDIVFDGFCGTGMAGVAAQLCGDRKEVESLDYIVDKEGRIFDPADRELPISHLGSRRAVLNDLSTAATFIAYNYNNPVDSEAFEKEATRILNMVENDFGWMYETWHPNCVDKNRVKGRINYTVWSDVFVCPECGTELVFWDIAVDHKTGYRKGKKQPLLCSDCKMQAPLSSFERAWSTDFDSILGVTRRFAKKVPILINYSVGKQKFEKALDKGDFAILEKVNRWDVLDEFPNDRMPLGDESRRNDNIGFTHVHHFYTKRNLIASAYLAKLVNSNSGTLKLNLLFWLQTIWLGQTLLNRYLAASFSQVNRYLKGTLYIAPFNSEVSPWYALTGKIKTTKNLDFSSPGATTITAGSADSQLMANEVLDYIFTDPPFGANINYADLNFIWESWLRVTTNSKREAIVSKAQNKNLIDYQRMMTSCFIEYARLLKPGKWMTVEFHNSKNSVWNAIQESLLRAGFMVADVRTLDKKQMTMQQMTTTSAVKQDLIISAYKPHKSFEKRFLEEAGSIAGAWDFVSQHLAQLPIVVMKGSALEKLGERQDYLLFDRMLAFHIQRGAKIPLSAYEFYAGLRERYIERDGMFFLPDQVPEYDKARLQAKEVAQLTLFVTDEKSSIQWLRQQLAPDFGGHPQTYQDLQPKFLKQLHQLRHEALPELSQILEQNFLEDDQGCWYVPDPNKASDLEKLRQRALLREFNEYLKARKKLKVFRTEAVRAGFAAAWSQNEYATIVRVAERLPDKVIQEDPDLLMYYDNAGLLV